MLSNILKFNCCAFALLSLLIPIQQARSSALSRTLWVDSGKFDLSSATNLSRLLGQPVGTLVLPAFINGQTTYPTHNTMFVETPLYAGKSDVLERAISSAHTHHMRVFLSIDCLHWADGSESTVSEVFSKHPEMEERDVQGVCGNAPFGAYATPFSPTVIEQLTKLVSEIGKRYPAVDGIVLECHLQSGSLLAYSDESRLAYIHATGIDPEDLDFKPSPISIEATSQWEQWRIDRVTDLVGALSKAYHRSSRKGLVYGVGDVDWSERTIGDKNTTLEDWPTWAKDGYVTKVFLAATWRGASYNADLSAMPPVVGPGGQEVPVCISIPFGGNGLDPLSTLESLQGHGTDGLVAEVMRPDDLSRANYFWKKTLPFIEPALAR